MMEMKRYATPDSICILPQDSKNIQPTLGNHNPPHCHSRKKITWKVNATGNEATNACHPVTLA